MNAIIALDPRQMAEAQTTTVAWIDRKIGDCHREQDDAQALFDSLNRARLDVRPATRAQDACARRLRFYEKVKMALEAGYYIVPPFVLQAFAIRVDRKANPDVSTRQWVSDETPPRVLPAGAGRFVNPQPPRVWEATRKERIDATDQTRDIDLYRNGDWGDVALPVRALKPEIIDAVGKALEEKVFDVLGIAPAYRSSDPIICGRILHPDGKRALTFFVAWWLDESDL